MKISSEWIVNQWFDLKWFIGASTLSYLCLYLLFGVGISSLFLFGVFTCVFDAPHLIGTLIRTFFDKEEFKERQTLYLGSLSWFLLGPITILFGEIFQTKSLYFAFTIFFPCYGWYHILRQHYGFMVLYQKKNNEKSGLDNKVDYWCFHLLMIISAIVVIVKNSSLKRVLRVEAELLKVVTYFSEALSYLVIGVLLFWIIAESKKIIFNNMLNLPKILFLISSVSLPVYLCFSKYTQALDYISILVVITIFHNVQYHGIVWFYSQKRYHSMENEQSLKKFGLASLVTKNPFIFIGFCIFCGTLWKYSKWWIIGSPYVGTPSETFLTNYPIGNLFQVENLVFSIFVGLSLQHYYLDQKIWRTKKDVRLQSNLGISR